MVLDLIPAYGRNYPQLSLALRAWAQGADFKIHNGPYCSSRDAAQMIKRGLHRVRFWGQTAGKSWIVLGEAELGAYVTAATVPATATEPARALRMLTVGAALDFKHA